MDNKNNENENEEAKDNPVFSYFDLNAATKEVKKNFANGDISEKAKSSAKLVGKTLFNASLFAGKLGLEVIKSAPHALEKHNNQIRELKLKYEAMSDIELLRTIHEDGFFKANQKERAVIHGILTRRGITIESQSE